jgi:hypothetical protein
MKNLLHLVRKKGIPALTYSTTHANIPWPCTLKILHDSDLQFMLSLETPVQIHGSDDKHSFVLRFDGDILIPGKSKLEGINIRLSAALVDSITRQGHSQVQTLSLSLKAPCSLWYPFTAGSEATSLCTPSQELVTIAKATEVRIVFDTKWVGHENLAQLRSAVEGSRQLTAIPVKSELEFTLSHRQANLNPVEFVDPTTSSSVEDVVSVAGISVVDAVPGAYPSAEDATLDILPSVEVEDDIRNYGAPPAYSSKRSRTSKSSRQTQQILLTHIVQLTRRANVL